MLVDIDIPAGSTFIVQRRTDGSMTVSLDRRALDKAYEILIQNDAMIAQNRLYDELSREGKRAHEA